MYITKGTNIVKKIEILEPKFSKSVFIDRQTNKSNRKKNKNLNKTVFEIIFFSNLSEQFLWDILLKFSLNLV